MDITIENINNNNTITLKRTKTHINGIITRLRYLTLVFYKMRIFFEIDQMLIIYYDLFVSVHYGIVA